jgi:transcription initiation factor TFIID subunit 6
LNTYLASELAVRPPCELKCTLHWLAIDGVQPMIPENQIWTEAYYNNIQSASRPALAPLATTTTPSSLLLQLDNDDDYNTADDKSSIRIRELQQRILSEELRLYYERVTSTIDKSNTNNNNMSSSSLISTKSQSQQLDATNNTITTISSVLHGLKYDFGLQELVPFLSRYIACGLLSLSTTTTTTTTTKKSTTTTTTTATTTPPPPSLTYCYRLIQVLDAMLSNTNLHLELHLHQLIVPIGTCIVARNLGGSTTSSSSTTSANTNNSGGGGSSRTKNNNNNNNWYCNHWSLREEAARVLHKACTLYGPQYPTLTSRVIKLLTHQALRLDRPLVTQYGGIVGLSYFGPRIVDAFILPIAREYWVQYDDERRRLVASITGGGGNNNNNNNNNKSSSLGGGDVATTTTLGGGTTTKKMMKKRDIIEREYELTMCQVALLDAIQVFMMGVSPGEQSRRVDITTFADVFGERLVPMQPDHTEYTMAII